MRTTARQRGSMKALVASGIMAVALSAGVAACGDDTGGGDEAGGGTDEVRTHLESLEAAYADGGTSEVESHLRALDSAWDDAQSDVEDSDSVQQLIDTLETQVDDQAPPDQVSATVAEITQALSSS
jgi:hypothetical protein